MEQKMPEMYRELCDEECQFELAIDESINERSKLRN